MRSQPCNTWPVENFCVTTETEKFKWWWNWEKWQKKQLLRKLLSLFKTKIIYLRVFKDLHDKIIHCCFENIENNARFTPELHLSGSVWVVSSAFESPSLHPSFSSPPAPIRPPASCAPCSQTKQGIWRLHPGLWETIMSTLCYFLAFSRQRD